MIDFSSLANSIINNVDDHVVDRAKKIEVTVDKMIDNINVKRNQSGAKARDFDEATARGYGLNKNTRD